MLKFQQKRKTCFIAQMHSLEKSEFDFSRSRTEKIPKIFHMTQRCTTCKVCILCEIILCIWNWTWRREKKLINIHSTNKIIIISLTSRQGIWKKNSPTKKRAWHNKYMYASNAKTDRWTMECVFLFVSLWQSPHFILQHFAIGFGSFQFHLS